MFITVLAAVALEGHFLKYVAFFLQKICWSTSSDVFPVVGAVAPVGQ